MLAKSSQRAYYNAREKITRKNENQNNTIAERILRYDHTFHTW